MAIAANPETRTMTPEQLTLLYIGDLLHRAIIKSGESVKASDLVQNVYLQGVDLQVIRVTMLHDRKRFTVDNSPAFSRAPARDRRWTVWSRFLDSQRTVDHNLHVIFNSVGTPLTIKSLATELQYMYGRPLEVYEETVSRLVKQGSRMFYVNNELIAPAEWLLSTDLTYIHQPYQVVEDQDADILFYNFLSDEETLHHSALAESCGLSTDPATITDFLEKLNMPIRSKAIQFLAYQRDRDGFDAAKFYAALALESDAIYLTNGTWISRKYAATLSQYLPAIAKMDVSDNAEVEVEVVAEPLEITGDLLGEFVDAIQENDGFTTATELLASILEITPSMTTFEQDLNSVIDSLKAEDSILWVGSDRFTNIDNVPPYVNTVPALLLFEDERYLDADGEEIDVLLEIEGLEGGLDRDILLPVVQDVMDEEPTLSEDTSPPSSARLVIKYHHKQIGTMPLAHFPNSFFPREPKILVVDFELPGNQVAHVWVNNETRLLYGLLDWFQQIKVDSGATFTLERKEDDRFVVTYNEETEPNMFFSRTRLNDLLALQERAELEKLPTYEIIREIMEHYKKGMEFVTMHTEVNIVRRTSRLAVASILSAYHCFYQRNGAWVFDPKKVAQGFDKSKRKYLLK